MGIMDVQKIGPNGVYERGYKNGDYARAGVREMHDEFPSCEHTVSHLSQLNVIVPPMIII